MSNRSPTLLDLLHCRDLLAILIPYEEMASSSHCSQEKGLKRGSSAIEEALLGSKAIFDFANRFNWGSVVDVAKHYQQLFCIDITCFYSWGNQINQFFHT